jgi:predicted acetyltransferase
MANHYWQIDTIVWSAPVDDMTYMDMSDPRKLMYKQPYVVGRIVDVEHALRGIKTSAEFDLRLRVIDPVLPWNDGVFSLRNINGTLEMLPCTSSPRAVVPITTLAQLLWGYITPLQAKRQGKLETLDDKAVKALEKVFTPTTTYIIEDY